MLWSPKDVARYRRAAWPGGALLIWLMWETGADSTGVIAWRKDVHFRDTAQPAVLFSRGKGVGKKGVVPISRELAAAIRANGSVFFITDPQGVPYPSGDHVDEATLTAADNRRGRDFRAVQKKAGGRRLLLDHLRHSAATHAVDNGATLDDTTAVTLHKSQRVLESVYVQLTEEQATRVQKLRGII